MSDTVSTVINQLTLTGSYSTRVVSKLVSVLLDLIIQTGIYVVSLIKTYIQGLIWRYVMVDHNTGELCKLRLTLIKSLLQSVINIVEISICLVKMD